MANLLAHFEPSELTDFMNFIGLLIHKLQVRLALDTKSLFADLKSRGTCSMYSIN